MIGVAAAMELLDRFGAQTRFHAYRHRGTRQPGRVGKRIHARNADAVQAARNL